MLKDSLRNTLKINLDAFWSRLTIQNGRLTRPNLLKEIGRRFKNLHIKIDT